MTVEIYRPAGADVDGWESSAQFKLGTIAEGQDGRSFVYVLSSGSLAADAVCGIDEDFTAIELTTTTAAAMHAVGWPEVGCGTGKYGWLCRNGTNFNGLVADNSSADAPLYTTATAGYLSSDSSTANPIKVVGVTCVAVTSGGGASELIATWPHIDE